MFFRVKNIFLIIVFFDCLFSFSYAQNISFLNDYIGNVIVFDNGKTQEIEQRPLRSYQIGNNAMAYEDNAGNFKIYYNHYVYNVGVYVEKYYVSNNYIAFSYKGILKLFDNGDIVLLSLSSSSYYIGSNIAIWYDNGERVVKAYYNKKFYRLDDALASNSVKEIYGANNIAVFIDNRNFLNIFYKEEIFPIDFSERISFVKAGEDVVAFIDELNNSFQSLYFGEIIEIENFKPTSFKTGNGFVAYIDANGYFKVFRNFAVETLDFNTPDFYEIKNNIMVFGMQNYFKAYLNSKVYTLESFIPSSYIINNGVCAYLDQQGFLKYFDGEKTKTISYETIKDFEINGDIVKYKYGINSESIYFKGKTYNNY